MQLSFDFLHVSICSTFYVIVITQSPGIYGSKTNRAIMFYILSDWSVNCGDGGARNRFTLVMAQPSFFSLSSFTL